MQVGIFSVADHYPSELARSSSEFFNELISQAVEADRLGFHSFWLAEHHFHEYGAVPRPALVLSAIAAKTSRIRLGPAVAILPFDNPLRVAEDFAILDIVSNGRLDFGVGSGYLSHEYAGFSVDASTRREQFDEALSIITQAWRGERFSFEGKFYRVDDLQLNVLPLQKPQPEISIAVLRNEAAKFVGLQRRGMLMIPYASTEKLDELAETCSAYKSAYAEATEAVAYAASSPQAGSEGACIVSKSVGTASMPSSAAHNYAPKARFALHTYCGKDTHEAREFARPYMERYVRTRLYAKHRPFDLLIEKNLIAVGDSAEILRVARLYKDAGLDDFLMLMNFGGMPSEAVLESMALISEQVIPELCSGSVGAATAAASASS